MWYGKGPGVDRCGDVFKHANAAGTSPHGGVLAIAGDDHACKSSTLPHQSEYAFMDACIPVLNPAGVQEILDLGLFGWELSRYCGCWVGLKTIAETVDASASVAIDPHRVATVYPDDLELPAEGLHIRWPDRPTEQEHRLHRYKLYAALAFARANRLNRVVIDGPRPRLGIISTGKSYLDVRQALEDLGIDEKLAADIGLRVFKVGMSWPLERESVRQFAQGLDEILVVEEKRAVIENQLKEQLYHWQSNVRPRVIGKFDERGEWVLPSMGELTPARIARVIAGRITRYHSNERIQQRLEFLERKERALAKPRLALERIPHFCSGCPHNTSTQVPEGSRALAGIGCHYMATWMDRRTETFTQMGGEGVPWIGQAPFTETRHVFANLGDGTYFHSGLLAIRAAVAAGVNVTYKLLYNDAVAMTGGQPLDGTLSVQQITHQLFGEGVRRIAVMSDEPEKYLDRGRFAVGTTFHHRRELDGLQRELRDGAGVSVLIYDQTCAAEKRRRRKRGHEDDPPRRAFINEAVCEGCGDCATQSNCLSVVPVETELGRKRAIDQSACNKDFSCVEGFCPSFVTVHGAQLRKPHRPQHAEFGPLPEPAKPALTRPYDIVITGVGGTGVVTIGALLGMAAHLEGKGVSVLDMTGLAQKGGSVVSHVRIGERPEDIAAARVAAGNARLLLGCDLVVAAAADCLTKVGKGVTQAVVNSHRSITSAFLREPDLKFPAHSMERAIVNETGVGRTHLVDATRLATALVGDAIASNLFMLGYAYQRGLVPLSAPAIERAIELNGVAVDSNCAAFSWGRRVAHEPAAVEAIVRSEGAPKPRLERLQDIVHHRMAHLTQYQNPRLAQRYRALVERVATIESALVQSQGELARAVARSYAKLLAYKDEYEVARLLADHQFQTLLRQHFDGKLRLEFHLATPLLARREHRTGRLCKRNVGPWVLPVFRLLSRLRFLRGTLLDPFGYSTERRLDRTLISEFENTVESLLTQLGGDNHATAVEIVQLEEQIRGYGHIKEASLQQVRIRQEQLMNTFRDRLRLAQAA